MFYVRKFNKDHTCNMLELYIAQSQANSIIITKLVIDKFHNPKTIYTSNDITKDVFKDYSIELTYMQAQRAREQVIELMRGHSSSSYGKIPMYFYIITYKFKINNKVK